MIVIQNIQRTFENSTIRKWPMWFENWQKTWTDTSSKKIYKWQANVWKDVEHQKSYRSVN